VRAEQAEHAARAERAERGAEAESEIAVPMQQALPEQHFPAPVPEETVHAAAAELPPVVAATEPAFMTEPAAVPAAQAQPAPMPVTVPAQPAPSPLPEVEVEKALQESGLVMIKTDPNKLKAVAPAVERAFVPPQPRPRRAPPPDTGPLQIVETRKDA